MKKLLFAYALLPALLMTACSGAAAAPTSTPIDVNAVQTSVVETIVANVTQTAAAIPTATETPTPAPTATETPVAVPSATPGCENSALVTDASVPDGSSMPAGQAFIKTWRIKNTGTCTWTTDFKIIFAYGAQLGGQETHLANEVASNTETEISVNMQAPSKSGTYNGYWILADKNNYTFGQYFTVVIVVP